MRNNTERKAFTIVEIVIVIAVIAILFVVFTFLTPEIGIFRDPLTGTYGVQ